MAGKESFSQLDYRIKLLPNNNVVLVECNNYDSEVFSPHIVNGRITFLNVIPNRRCCQISKSNVMNFVKKELQQTTSFFRKQNLVRSETILKYSANGRLAINSPLANSTPECIKQRHSSDNELSKFYSCSIAMDSSLQTPEPARRAAPERSVLLEKSMFNIPVCKVSRIYPTPVKGKPKKIGRLVIPDVVKQSSNANVSLLDGNFLLHCSPILPTNSQNKNNSKNLLHSTPVDCVARWQKVLTPVRTYARKSGKSETSKRTKTAKNIKIQEEAVKVTPTYLRNPTQGLNVSQQIVIKKCKLIMDSKTKISPRTFKKQQNITANAATVKSGLSLHLHSLSFHKPRPYLETMGMSAFDLLTSSNRNRMIARNLHEQFRRGCVNKASSTYSKYKVISTVPPIQDDKQVLELSCASSGTSL